MPAVLASGLSKPLATVRMRWGMRKLMPDCAQEAMARLLSAILLKDQKSIQLGMAVLLVGIQHLQLAFLAIPGSKRMATDH